MIRGTWVELKAKVGNLHFQVITFSEGTTVWRLFGVVYMYSTLDGTVCAVQPEQASGNMS